MRSFPSKLLDLLYPRRCALCDGILKRDEPFICRSCAGNVRFRNTKTCLKCGRPLADRNESPELCDECVERSLPHDACIAPFAYSGVIRDSLMRFKYHDRPEYAGFFAEAILHYGREQLYRWRPDALVPVPVHDTRLAKRGYNQAALLAKELSKRTGIPVAEGLTARNRKTEAQKELGFEDRRQNLRGAFLYTGQGSAPPVLAVVDDIFTTGSTMGTLAEILKENGTEKVYGICVCS